MGEHRHKRETEARRTPPALAVIGPLALLATASAVTMGVLNAEPVATAPVAEDLTTVTAAVPGGAGSATREVPVTRSKDRTASGEIADPADQAKSPPPISAFVPSLMSKAAIRTAIDNATLIRWTTEDLDIWTRPGTTAKDIGELADGKKVTATGRKMWGRTEIVLDGRSRWVTDGYLSAEEPPKAAAGLSMQPCPDGSVENGLTDAAVYVYRSVCHAFPQITSYGGWDNHGEHSSGRALDVMTSDVALGSAIAEFLRAHASELGLYDVIWRQRIWTPERAGEGWRMMPSRGSATANHYDHVHVAVY